MADRRISELDEATTIARNDLFVMEQAYTVQARKVKGQTLENWLLEMADGHGGIHSLEKTGSSGTNPVIDTYTITYADETTSTFTVTNGLKGDTGDQTFVYIKYSETQPTSDSDMTDTPSDWIGVCETTASPAPTTYTSYRWFKIKGEKGDKGDDAFVASTSIMYQASSSGTVPPGEEGWTTTIPFVAQSNFLWSRTIVEYTDGGQTCTYSASRMGRDGSGSVVTVCDQEPDANGNVSLDYSNVGALPNTYVAPVTSVNGYTGAVNLYAAYVNALPDTYVAPVTSVNGETGAVVLNAEKVNAKNTYRMVAEFSSAGWYRIANIDSTMLATILEFGAFVPYSTGAGTERGEVHKIKYATTYGANAVFSGEYSQGDTHLIDKIRRTYGGTTGGKSTWGFDIHYTGNTAMTVYAELSVSGHVEDGAVMIADLAAVATAPSGESVYPEKSISRRTEGDIKGLFSLNNTSGGSCSITSAYRIGHLVSLFITTTTSGAVSTGSDIYVGTLSGPLPKCGAITNGYYSNRAIIGRIESDGTIRFRVTGASGDSVPSGQNSYFFFNYLTE